MYPGELGRQRCATRTRAELLEYAPKRPLALRDELRLRGMLARCETCAACPLVIRTLTIMAPAKPEPASAQIFRLAG
jgi:hypothetical protein